MLSSSAALRTDVLHQSFPKLGDAALTEALHIINNIIFTQIQDNTEFKTTSQ